MANHSSKAPRLVPVPRPEEVLAQRYDQLRVWALGLTRGDINVAHDIVHDLYLYVTLAKPDFAPVENLDKYLYKCLRHIHLAYLAESSRNALRQISVADLDSLHFALWATPESYVLEHQNELRQICHYAVWRKEQIKSASFFVLRFFHGYHLQEIGELTNLSLSVVQPKLSRMRAEIQHYIEKPGDPQFAGAATEGLHWTPLSSPELFRELRATIMRARTGNCLCESELLAHYLAPIPKAIPCPLLSHIVSCEHCLSIIDRHFRRPTLRDRESLDGLGSPARGKLRKGGADMSFLSHKELLQIALAHHRDVYEHRPRLLSIAVDGRIIASHRVQAQNSVQSVRIERPDQIGCVEIFSEQDVRLALVLLEDLPPQGPTEKVERIKLSDGRWIEVRLIFDSLGLNTEVTYFDPLLPTEAGASMQENDAEVVPIRLVPAVSNSSSEKAESEVDQEPLRSHSLAAWWSRLCSGVKLISLPDINPLLASGTILALASFVCFFAWTYKQPRITPSDLLDHAAKWDSAVADNARPGVIYQRVRITTRKRTVERTIYRDAQGIRRPRQQRLSREDEQLKDNLANASIHWEAPLSAIDFADWRRHSGATRDAVRRSGQHLLTLTTTPLADGAVLKETLTVRDTDFHAVDRTVELRDSGTIEIAELNYDVMPWGAVNQDWFEPVSRRSLIDTVPAHPASPAILPHVVSESELDEAELNVRVLLNQLHADTGEQILVSRSASGIEVKGIVETDQRKRQLGARLAQVAHVHPSLLSVEELGSHPQFGSSHTWEPVQAYSVEARPSPLEEYVREKGMPADQLAEISQGLFDQSVRIQQAQVHLYELHQRFKEVKQLPADQQNHLAELSRIYVNAIEAGLDANARTLQSIGLDGREQTPPSFESSAPGEEIDRQVRRYQELCQQLVTGASGEPLSAAVIAGEIKTSGTLIRAGATQIHSSVSTAHN